LRNAFKDGWQAFLSLLQVLATIWPIYILGGGVFMILTFWKKRSHLKKSEAK